MLAKWAIGGAVLGTIASVKTGTNPASGVAFGAAAGVIIRKWIAKKLWM